MVETWQRHTLASCMHCNCVAAAVRPPQPALSMGLRLGEGSGAALALPLLRAAAAMIGQMGTLHEALAL